MTIILLAVSILQCPLIFMCFSVLTFLTIDGFGLAIPSVGNTRYRVRKINNQVETDKTQGFEFVYYGKWLLYGISLVHQNIAFINILAVSIKQVSNYPHHFLVEHSLNATPKNPSLPTAVHRQIIQKCQK